MKLLSRTSADLKKQNPYYYRMLKAAVVAFFCGIFFFVANLIASWLELSLVQNITMISFVVCLLCGVFLYLGLWLVAIYGFICRLKKGK